MEYQPVVECDFEELLALPSAESKAEVELKRLRRNICILKSKIYNYHVKEEREIPPNRDLVDTHIALNSNNDNVLGDLYRKYNNIIKQKEELFQQITNYVNASGGTAKSIQIGLAGKPTGYIYVNKITPKEASVGSKADLDGNNKAINTLINNIHEERIKNLDKTHQSKIDNLQNGDINSMLVDLVGQGDCTNKLKFIQVKRIAGKPKLLRKQEINQSQNVCNNKESVPISKVEHENGYLKKKIELLMNFVKSLTKLNNANVLTKCDSLMKRLDIFDKHNPFSEFENQFGQSHSPSSTTDIDAFTSEDERDSVDSGLMSPYSSGSSPNPNVGPCGFNETTDIDPDNFKAPTPNIEPTNLCSTNAKSSIKNLSIVTTDIDCDSGIRRSPRLKNSILRPVTTQVNNTSVITVSTKKVIKGIPVKRGKFTMCLNKEPMKISPVKKTDVASDTIQELFDKNQVESSNLTLRLNQFKPVKKSNIGLDPIQELCVHQTRTKNLSLRIRKEIIDISPVITADVGLNPIHELLKTVNVGLDPIEELAKISQVKTANVALDPIDELAKISQVKTTNVALDPIDELAKISQVKTANVALDPIDELAKISQVKTANVALDPIDELAKISQVKTANVALDPIEELAKISKVKAENTALHPTGNLSKICHVKTVNAALDPFEEISKIHQVNTANAALDSIKVLAKRSQVETANAALDPIESYENSIYVKSNEIVLNRIQDLTEITLKLKKELLDKIPIKTADVALDPVIQYECGDSSSSAVTKSIAESGKSDVSSQMLSKEVNSILNEMKLPRVLSPILEINYTEKETVDKLIQTDVASSSMEINESCKNGFEQCDASTLIEVVPDISHNINNNITLNAKRESSEVTQLNTKRFKKNLKRNLKGQLCDINDFNKEVTISSLKNISQIVSKSKRKYNGLFGSDEECDIPKNERFTTPVKTNTQDSSSEESCLGLLLRNPRQSVEQCYIDKNVNNTVTVAKQSVEENIIPNDNLDTTTASKDLTPRKEVIANPICKNSELRLVLHRINFPITNNSKQNFKNQSSENNIPNQERFTSVPKNNSEVLPKSKRNYNNLFGSDDECDIPTNKCVKTPLQAKTKHLELSPDKMHQRSSRHSTEQCDINKNVNNTIEISKQVETNIVFYDYKEITRSPRKRISRIVSKTQRNNIVEGKEALGFSSNECATAPVSINIQDINLSPGKMLLRSSRRSIEQSNHNKNVNVNNAITDLKPVETNEVSYDCIGAPKKRISRIVSKTKLDCNTLEAHEECDIPNDERATTPVNANINLSSDKIDVRSFRKSVEQCDNKNVNDTKTDSKLVENGVVAYGDLDMFTTDVTATTVNNKPTAKKVNSHEDNVFCKMLKKYGRFKINNIWIKNDSYKLSIEKLSAEMETDINNILSQQITNTKPVIMELADKMNKVDRKVFLSALIYYLQDEKRKSDVICKRYTPPAPAMTKPEQVLLFILTAMKDKDKNIIVDVLSNIEFALFRLNHAPDTPQVELLSHFYAVLCRVTGNKSRLRTFMLDAMYCLTFKATVLIQECLNVWMNVLPLAHMNAANNPLVKCFVYLLHFFKCEDYHNKLQHLRLQLKRCYSYDMTEWNQTVFLEYLQNCFADLRDNSLEKKTLRMCLLILSKRHGAVWCEKNIINNIILPLIEDSGTSESTRSFCISMLGPLMRPFPPNMKLRIDMVISKLHSILSEKCSAKIEEAVVTSLIHISIHHTAQVMRIIISWQPQYEISNELETCFSEFIRSRPVSAWIKLLQIK